MNDKAALRQQIKCWLSRRLVRSNDLNRNCLKWMVLAYCSGCSDKALINYIDQVCVRQDLVPQQSNEFLAA